MHTPDTGAHGLFAAAILTALTRTLIDKGVISKREMQDICATVQKDLGEKGLRNDSAIETGAAILASSLSTEIGRS